MITQEEIIEIGKFQKTHALKGELNALLDVDADYAEDGFPLIVEMDGIFVPFYVESIRTKGSESFLVKLSDVDSQEDARQFVNKLIYALRKDLAEYYGEEEIEAISDFIGYAIRDENYGDIGTVKELEDSTANVLFVAEDKEGRTIYIPAAEEFIVEIDDDNKVIRTRLPEGLVDLNP